jgi:hypothetical protein
MWISPNHPNPPKQNQVPEERGERLALFPRGPREEMHVTLDTFKNSQFLRLQLWEIDGFPIKGKGCSIRLGEVVELRDVLDKLIVELGLDRKLARATVARPKQLEHSRPAQAPRPQVQADAGHGHIARPGFDEFSQDGNDR